MFGTWACVLLFVLIFLMSLVSKFQRSQWLKWLCQYFIIFFSCLWLLKFQTLFGRLLKYIVLFWSQQVDRQVFVGYSGNKSEDTSHFVLRFLFHFFFLLFIIKVNKIYNQDSLGKSTRLRKLETVQFSTWLIRDEYFKMTKAVIFFYIPLKEDLN